MQPKRADAALLWDMLDAARRAILYVAGMTFPEYVLDDKTQAAVERRLEIVGEASRRISKPFRIAHPEIPWPMIAGQRHVLAHDYGDIDHSKIWEVLIADLPNLITQLERLLPPPPPDPEPEDS